MEVSEVHPMIKEYGGKNGVLMIAQDSPDLVDRIVPFEILKFGESLTLSQLRNLKKYAEKYGVDEFIIRTSHVGDWKGLVDVMPTKIATSFNDIEKVLEQVFELLGSNRLKVYAESDDVSFLPEDCSISIAPYLGRTMTTVTEHPNTKEESIFIDKIEPLGRIFSYSSEDFYGSKGMNLLSAETQNYAFNELRNIFREKLGFPPDALQWEMGWDKVKNGPVLYQVRHFTDRVVSELYDTEKLHENRNGTRSFGTTYVPLSEKEIEDLERKWEYEREEILNLYFANKYSAPLMIVRTPKSNIPNYSLGADIGDMEGIPEWGEFERIHPQIRYLLLNTAFSYEQEPLSKLPKNMMVYFGKNPALGHHHTKYVQRVLRNPQGAAVLGVNNIAEEIADGIATQLTYKNEKLSEVCVMPNEEVNLKSSLLYVSELEED